MYATRAPPYLSIQYVHTKNTKLHREAKKIYGIFTNEPSIYKSNAYADVHPHFTPAPIPTHHVTLFFWSLLQFTAIL